MTAPPSKHELKRLNHDDTNNSISGCGSQADTAIIKDSEIASGKAGPLGRTQGNGVVDAAVMVGAFMGTGAAPPANNGASGSVGVEDNIQGQAGQQQKRQLLAGLLGGGKGKAGGAGAGATGIAGLLGGGGDKNTGPPEAGVAAAAGAGASSGLPTAAADGTVTMTMRQVSHGIFSHQNRLTIRRSTRTELVPSQPMWMAPPAEPARLLCSPLPSPKTFPVWASKVSLLRPPPTSR